MLATNAVNLTPVENIQDALGPEHCVASDTLHNMFTVYGATITASQRLVTTFITHGEYKFLMASAQDSDDETKRLREFFWGTKQPQDSSTPTINLPKGQSVDREFFFGIEPQPKELRDPTWCQHESHEVTLFQFPSIRCKHCDLKRPEGDKW